MRMDSDVWAGRWAVEGEGGGDDGTFDAKYWPAPPTIHRGLEWPQCLNCLFVCLFA